jgi:hypothetical protein
MSIAALEETPPTLPDGNDLLPFRHCKTQNDDFVVVVVYGSITFQTENVALVVVDVLFLTGLDHHVTKGTVGRHLACGRSSYKMVSVRTRFFSGIEPSVSACASALVFMSSKQEWKGDFKKGGTGILDARYARRKRRSQSLSTRRQGRKGIQSRTC